MAQLTGIGIDTLRAWERRYQAVVPTRDHRGRVYTEADVARLRLLNKAVSSGHSIGRIASLNDAHLRRLAPQRPTAKSASPAVPVRVDTQAVSTALARFDMAAIDQELARMASLLPPLDLVRDVLLPMLRDVGDAWNRRRGGIALEHAMSSAIRQLLGTFLRIHARRGASTRLLFATPSGDRHEIGILGAAMLAAGHGLAVSYVGPDLPSRDIVAAVRAADAKVLVLGLTLTRTDSETRRELRTITRHLPRRVELWAGGAGAVAHKSLLAGRGLLLDSFDLYEEQLSRLGGPKSAAAFAT